MVLIVNFLNVGNKRHHTLQLLQCVVFSCGGDGGSRTPVQNKRTASVATMVVWVLALVLGMVLARCQHVPLPLVGKLVVGDSLVQVVVSPWYRVYRWVGWGYWWLGWGYWWLGWGYWWLGYEYSWLGYEYSWLGWECQWLRVAVFQVAVFQVAVLHWYWGYW
jgi:hypothetical protein